MCVPAALLWQDFMNVQVRMYPLQIWALETFNQLISKTVIGRSFKLGQLMASSPAKVLSVFTFRRTLSLTTSKSIIGAD